jgi:hypothetical protein
MMCFKCGSENTGYRAICNTCMTTQAIEDQTKVLQSPRSQNVVESTLSWIGIFIVWGMFFWLIYHVLVDQN